MKEFDIRPKALFDEYLKISRQDIQKFFTDKKSFVETACPGCSMKDSVSAFEKDGFSYRQCPRCFSLFVSPRPTEAVIQKFYRDSDSSKFWAERFFPETAEARREKIFKPRVKMMIELVAKFGIPHPPVFVDIGAGIGIFLEEVKKTGMFQDIIGIEPSIDLAKCLRQKGFKVIEKPVEMAGEDINNASVACSFEVLEHLFNPAAFINSMAKLLKPDGLLIFTTLTVSGLDLLVLWDKSKSISPPHHINFLSVEGLRALLKSCGLEEIEITTPGKLDVDIINNARNENDQLVLPRFMEYLLKNRSEKTFVQLQEFLQENNLSSHVRVVARKKK